MSPDIPAIQKSLAIDGVDGWLLYDFHGSNPIAVRMAGLTGAHTTRRWFYFIPASGTPQKLVHAIEPFVLEARPGRTRLYAGRQQLEQQLGDLLRGCKIVAMEYSNECSIPYIARVDAGTVDMLRRMGMRIVSSGDLVSRFEAAWDDAAVASHRAASERLYRIKDQAFRYIAAKLAAGDRVHEYEVQQAMVQWFRDEGLVADAPPVVSSDEHTGNPHYAPSADQSRAINPDEVVLVDLWGKLDVPGSVYADITWTGFTGDPPAHVSRTFGIAVAGRDAAIARVQAAIRTKKAICGFEVDRATRDVITAAGYGQRFIHRTGHSLGEEVHGNGVHMDDYETHDDRQLVVGTGFTIEPGIYTEEFGVRTEINMVIGPESADVTGPCQQTLVKIGARN